MYMHSAQPENRSIEPVDQLKRMAQFEAVQVEAGRDENLTQVGRSSGSPERKVPLTVGAPPVSSLLSAMP